jgi:Type I restriction enzyme R protein N terminus (HSDR_N)
LNLTCLIRKEPVAATPEELVRQQLIATMVGKLEYPESCLAVEKPLHQLPLLKYEKVPDRRLDLLCFAKESNGLYPLLLVECKAVKLTPKVLRQVCGYNTYVKAYFVAVANQSEVRIGWMDQKKREYCFASGLPPYPVLKEMINKS